LKKLTAKELYTKISSKEDVFLLDIRENYERIIGHIPSVHIPMAEVSSKLSDLPNDKEIVVLCKSGRRAEPVAHLLETEYNFNNISILEGGLTAWKEEIDSNLILD
jgi:rhodanese-related sulfurtransferase